MDKREPPKTVDGVPIIPPMTVYRIDINGFIDNFDVIAVEWSKIDNDWVLRRESNEEIPFPRLFRPEVYSTYEVAKAAREEMSIEDTYREQQFEQRCGDCRYAKSENYECVCYFVLNRIRVVNPKLGICDVWESKVAKDKT